jgi:hypothetical protein
MLPMRPEDMGDKPPLDEWAEWAGGFGIPSLFLQGADDPRIPWYNDVICPECGDTGRTTGDEDQLVWCDCPMGRIMQRRERR